MKAEISELKLRLAEKEEVQAKNIANDILNTTEKSMVKMELKNILKLHSEASISRNMTENQKLKLQSTHDLIFESINNLLIELGDEDAIKQAEQFHSNFATKTNDFESSIFSRIGGASTYDYSQNDYFDFKRQEHSGAQNRYNYGQRTEIEPADDRIQQRTKEDESIRPIGASTIRNRYYY